MYVILNPKQTIGYFRSACKKLGKKSNTLLCCLSDDMIRDKMCIKTVLSINSNLFEDWKREGLLQQLESLIKSAQ